MPPGRQAARGMPRTLLTECARCNVLVHRPDDEPDYGCPVCGRRLSRGLVKVGFADAAYVFGEPGEPWRAPPPPPPRPPRQYRFACKDGHKVRSVEERAIDDWLTDHGVPHEVEPKLKGMRPDWRVGEWYVEYWGMAGQQGYEARREEKLALYRERGLRLIELFPEDLAHLDAKLGALRDASGRGQTRLF